MNFFPQKIEPKNKAFHEFFPPKIRFEKVTPLKKTKIPGGNHFSKVGIVKKFFPQFFHLKNGLS